MLSLSVRVELVVICPEIKGKNIIDPMNGLNEVNNLCLFEINSVFTNNLEIKARVIIISVSNFRL